MDAKRTSFAALARLEARDGFSGVFMGQLQRGDDALSAGDRLTHLPDKTDCVVGLASRLDSLCGPFVSCRGEPSIHPSIFTSMGELSRQKREAASSYKLFPELGNGHSRAQGILHGSIEGVHELFGQRMGHHS